MWPYDQTQWHKQLGTPMYVSDREAKVTALVEESEQQLASCRKMLEQSIRRADESWKMVALGARLARGRETASLA